MAAFLYGLWLHSPTYKVVVLPAVAQLQDKLLPNMSDGPQPTVVVVDQAQAQRQPVGQTVAGCRLHVEKQVLHRGGHSRESCQHECGKCVWIKWPSQDLNSVRKRRTMMKLPGLFEHFFSVKTNQCEVFSNHGNRQQANIFYDHLNRKTHIHHLSFLVVLPSHWHWNV